MRPSSISSSEQIKERERRFPTLSIRPVRSVCRCVACCVFALQGTGMTRRVCARAWGFCGQRLSFSTISLSLSCGHADPLTYSQTDLCVFAIHLTWIRVRINTGAMCPSSVRICNSLDMDTRARPYRCHVSIAAQKGAHKQARQGRFVFR